jgi:transposase
LDTLRELVEREPDRTSFELTASYNLQVSRAARVHRSSIQRALTRLGYVYKKNARVRPSKIALTSR